jgi:hypothetical protein
MAKRLVNMTVQCGSLKWTGQCRSVRDAIIISLRARPPKRPAPLMRIHDGLIWHYIDIRAAMRLAGYSSAET